jgi:hypothetical protein
MGEVYRANESPDAKSLSRLYRMRWRATLNTGRGSTLKPRCRASLNYPNNASIYGLQKSPDGKAMVAGSDPALQAIRALGRARKFRQQSDADTIEASALR